MGSLFILDHVVFLTPTGIFPEHRDGPTRQWTVGQSTNMAPLQAGRCSPHAPVSPPLWLPNRALPAWHPSVQGGSEPWPGQPAGMGTFQRSPLPPPHCMPRDAQLGDQPGRRALVSGVARMDARGGPRKTVRRGLGLKPEKWGVAMAGSRAP